MIGKDDARKILDKVISYASGFEIEALLETEDIALTRFYDNHIHQNLRRQDHLLTVRVIKKKRSGKSQVNLLDDGSLRWAVQSALENMEASGEDESFPGLPKPEAPGSVQTHVPGTASFKPRERADACGVAISVARAKGLTAAGTFSTGVREKAVASSTGVRAYNSSTEAFFRCIVGSGPNTGYGDRLKRDVREIDVAACAEEALERATLYPDARDLPPGRYDTIFMEYAVADLIRFFGIYSFDAEAKQQGRSFMSDKMGQKVLGDNVTIWDDGLDTRGMAIPFDPEGMPKRKVVIIDKGVANAVVYDFRTATRDGVRTTGHKGGDSAWNPGPMPTNMFMDTGDSTLEEMIGSTKRGLIVTRFHYTHCPEPSRVVATGTTRDGTFLIEDGRIVARVKNLRFTESMVDAFGRVESLSKTSRITRDWWSTFEPVLPIVKIKEFNFTGATSF